MDGIVNILKPSGMSSHDVVAEVRRIVNLRKVGHTGTLDPGAAGVLPVVLGFATRLASYVQDTGKSYRAELLLGVATSTQDAAGDTVAITSDFDLPAGRLGEAVGSFLGRIHQVPPMTSALKYQGQRLYDLARAGREVERVARPVHIYELHVRKVFNSHEDRLTFGTRVVLDVQCSSGTYVRTLCHDIGEALGCGAHMTFLVRTQVGPFGLDDAVTLEELWRARREGRILEYVLPPLTAVSHLPTLQLGDSGVERIRHGHAVGPEHLAAGADPAPDGDEVAFVDPQNRLCALGRMQGDAPIWAPVKVFLPQ